MTNKMSPRTSYVPMNAEGVRLYMLRRCAAAMGSMREKLISDKYIDSSVTIQDMADGVIQFYTAMRRLAGPCAPQNRHLFTILPYSQLMDFSKLGSLAQILRCIAKNGKLPVQGYDLQNPEVVKELSITVRTLWKKLKEHRTLRPKRICFSEALSSEAKERLSKIVQSHEGEVVDHPARATHVIVPTPTALRMTIDAIHADGKYDYACVINRRISSTVKGRVHLLFLPDSYEEWHDNSSIQDLQDGAPEPTETIHVHEMWLEDLGTYNEWPNALDYSITDVASLHQFKWGAVKAAGQQATSIRKVKSLPQSGANDGMHLLDMDDDDDDDEPASKRTRREADIDVADAGQLQGERHAPDVYPSTAAWFDMEAVHDLERTALPEFFVKSSGLKASRTYRDVRNMMINMYRANPHQYLTPTAVRHRVALDAGAVIRIHSFLEAVGLINYGVAYGTRPNPVNFTLTSRTTGDGDEDDDEAVELHQPSSAVDNDEVLLSVDSLPPVIPRNDEFRRQFPPIIGDHKKALFDVARVPSNEPKWSEEELGRLVAAVHKHKDNWDAVSADVKSKTKEQCILQFVRLPLNETVGNAASISGGTTRSDSTPDTGRVPAPSPFADISNQVLTALTTLCTHAAPEVVQAAQQAALDAMKARKEAGASGDDAALEAAASTAVAISAATAREQREACADRDRKLLAALVKTQLKKVDLRMQRLEALEELVSKERAELRERARQLVDDHMRYLVEQATAQAKAKELSASLKPREEKVAADETKVQELKEKLQQELAALKSREEELSKREKALAERELRAPQVAQAPAAAAAIVAPSGASSSSSGSQHPQTAETVATQPPAQPSSSASASTAGAVSVPAAGNVASGTSTSLQSASTVTAVAPPPSSVATRPSATDASASSTSASLSSAPSAVPGAPSSTQNAAAPSGSVAPPPKTGDDTEMAD